MSYKICHSVKENDLPVGKGRVWRGGYKRKYDRSRGQNAETECRFCTGRGPTFIKGHSRCGVGVFRYAIIELLSHNSSKTHTHNIHFTGKKIVVQSI